MKNASAVIISVAALLVLLSGSVLGGAILRPQAAEMITNTSISCSLTSPSPEEFSCMASITNDGVTGGYSSGTVTFSTSGNGSFSPSSTCTVTEDSPSLSTCTVYYNPSATDTQVTITGYYSGDAENAASTGSTTINTILTSSSSTVTSSSSVATSTLTSSSSQTSTTSTTSSSATQSSTASSSSTKSSSSSIALSTSGIMAEIAVAGIVIGASILGFLVITRRSKHTAVLQNRLRALDRV